jgi:hypothetical protein
MLSPALRASIRYICLTMKWVRMLIYAFSRQSHSTFKSGGPTRRPTRLSHSTLALGCGPFYKLLRGSNLNLVFQGRVYQTKIKNLTGKDPWVASKSTFRALYKYV